MYSLRGQKEKTRTRIIQHQQLVYLASPLLERGCPWLRLFGFWPSSFSFRYLSRERCPPCAPDLATRAWAPAARKGASCRRVPGVDGAASPRRRTGAPFNASRWLERLGTPRRAQQRPRWVPSGCAGSPSAANLALGVFFRSCAVDSCYYCPMVIKQGHGPKSQHVSGGTRGI